MIRVECHCPEEALRGVRWPTRLDVRPLIGESVSSLDTKHARKIIGIEHIWRESTPSEARGYSLLYLKLERMRPD